ncbi:MAG: hypothetical protein KDD78_07305 [Caldilineaceae bacterium]|nr:hypothetical protein [Caldilineaceae bacterium]
MPDGELFAGEAMVLRRWIELTLAPRQESAWPQLVEIFGLRRLGEIFFLLDRNAGGDVSHFVTDGLPRLLQHLSRRTEQRRVEFRGQVRGRIDWPATHKARFAQDADPTRFVCREIHHQFDTAENQLLLALLHRIGLALQALPAFLRNGASIATASPVDPAYRRLATIEAGIRRARRNVYLRQVTLPPAVGAHHLYRARVAELEDYRHVLLLHQRLHQVTANPDAAQVEAYARRVGRDAFLLPGVLNQDAETWLRFGVETMAGLGRAREE